MHGYTKKSLRGVILTEAVVSLVVAAVVMAAAIDVRIRARREARKAMLYQQCVAAGQAQLESLSAGGGQFEAETVDELWPDIRLETTRTPGTGDWQGLDLATVRAEGKDGQVQTGVTLRRYVRARTRGRQP
jgi:Tfp pilus assembly protein PilV